MSYEVTAGRGRGPAVVPANQNVLPSRSLLVSSYTARAAPRFEKLRHQIGSIEESQLRRFEVCGAQHGGKVGPALLIVLHDRGRAREWSG